MYSFNNFHKYVKTTASISEFINYENLEVLYDNLYKSFFNNSRIFLAGNGGSAAIANHAATDLNKLKIEDNYLSAISLNTNVPSLLAIGNDEGFKNIFVDQLKNYKPQKEDILIAISSSGNSENIIDLIKYYKKEKIKNFSLLGFDGGEALVVSDYPILTKSEKKYYGPVEDLHMMVFHYFVHVIKNDIRELS
tara:strand:- start:1908 stop:2486 length:579 start_codon:yes stop_codon:yes gene_type:complete